MRCPNCPGENTCVRPDGPQTRGTILFIGETPNATEDKKNRPFTGKTGDEVDRHYLPVAGLHRHEVCFTYAVRCLPVGAGGKLDSNRRADIDLLESCARYHLDPHIQRQRPQVLVPMGAFACRAVFGEAFDLELRHGIPTDTPYGIPAFPMYHPSLGMHEPKKMLYIRNDWVRFRAYLAGKLKRRVDPYPNPDYREVTDPQEILDLDPTKPLGTDTESGREGPFCLTYSQEFGTGRLIRAERLDLLAALQERLDTWESIILFHNWLYDWTITEAMGLRLPYRRVVDTMARAYHLGNLPQGLKALAFRELGMVMQDFDDVVTPHSRQQVLEYYWAAYAERWEKPEPELVRDAGGKWKLYKAQSMNTKLKRFFTDYKKNPEKDVFGMWEKNWVDEQGIIEERVGLWPGKDIRHVPFDEALYYACRDSDADLRLWLQVLKPMSRLVRRYSQESWREKIA